MSKKMTYEEQGKKALKELTDIAENLSVIARGDTEVADIALTGLKALAEGISESAMPIYPTKITVMWDCPICKEINIESNQLDPCCPFCEGGRFSIVIDD